MHEPVKGRLEEYLSGAAGLYPEVDAHLAVCADCRQEVSLLRAQSRMFEALKPPRPVELRRDLYAGIMNRIETQARPSVWQLFSESIFAKRLAVASAACLLLLSSVLVSSVTDPRSSVVAASSPEVILAGQSDQLPPPIEVQPEKRGVVLVTLASYNQDYQ